MSTVITDAQVEAQREIIVVDNLPGRTTPLYLGSVLKGDVVTLSGWVTGTSYSDTMGQLTSLRATFDAQATMTIGAYTGYVESFSHSDRPGKKSQRLTIRLRRLPA
ncbi:MAG: hypothetical protein P1V51_20095 [Deltaproteobacteria bacterium]|nr:hypothetical protein [Deltaproteobacteria bacterium]